MTAAPRPVRLRRVMSTPGLVLFGLAAILPLTVFTTYGVVAQTTESHVPAAYFVTSVAMLFTAISYASLVAGVPSRRKRILLRPQGIRRPRRIPHRVDVDARLPSAAADQLLGDRHLLQRGVHIGARVALLAGCGVAVVTILVVVGITIVKNINLVLVASHSWPSRWCSSAWRSPTRHPASGTLTAAALLRLRPAAGPAFRRCGDPRAVVPRFRHHLDAVRGNAQSPKSPCRARS